MAGSVIGLTSIAKLAETGDKLSIEQSSLNFKAKLDEEEFSHPIVINYKSILDDYYETIEAMLKEYTFTTREYEKYKFQPRLFCLDQYGNMELFTILLKFNHMNSVLDFNQKTIKVLPGNIERVISEIQILEKRNMAINESEIL